MALLQEGGCLPGPQSGLCVTLGNRSSEETHVLTEPEASGKEHLDGERAGG